MVHGTRSCYQQGCRLTACKVANAAYEQQYRVRKRKGLPLLGALVSAAGASRRIAELQAEGYRKQDLARLMGLKRPILNFHTGSDAKTTWRCLIRLKRLHWEKLIKGADEMDAAGSLS